MLTDSELCPDWQGGDGHHSWEAFAGQWRAAAAGEQARAAGTRGWEKAVLGHPGAAGCQHTPLRVLAQAPSVPRGAIHHDANYGHCRR